MEYRTRNQFESIVDDCNNGNWNDAAKDCVKYGFYAHDLIKMNTEGVITFDCESDIAILAESAMKMRFNQ